MSASLTADIPGDYWNAYWNDTFPKAAAVSVLLAGLHYGWENWAGGYMQDNPNFLKTVMIVVAMSIPLSNPPRGKGFMHGLITGITFSLFLAGFEASVNASSVIFLILGSITSSIMIDTVWGLLGNKEAL